MTTKAKPTKEKKQHHPIGESLKLRFDRCLGPHSLSVYLYEDINQEKIAIPVKPLEFEVVDRREYFGVIYEGRGPHWLCDLHYDAGTPIIEELWNQGYRPKDVADRSDTINALKAEIEDLKTTRDRLMSLVEKLSREPDLLKIESKTTPYALDHGEIVSGEEPHKQTEGEQA